MHGDLSERLAVIEDGIAQACARSGRNRSSVQLVAVSKKHPPERVDALIGCGCRIFGESRVYEAQQKIELCQGGAEWHFIGHLQRNKVKAAVELFDRIHAVDSLSLLDKLEKCALDAGRRLPVMLEVNVAGESSKYGFAPDEVEQVLERAAALRALQVDGLMTIPPYASEPDASRRWFVKLRELRDRWAASTGMALAELSMGMSHDYAVAIEEGATWVRVGTALFGKRPMRKEMS